jgi:hypothetical protein
MVTDLTPLTQAEYDLLSLGDRIVRLSTGKTYVITIVWQEVMSCQILKGEKPWGRHYTVTRRGFSRA